MGQRFGDAALGDLVELDALDLVVGVADLFIDVPGDGLSSRSGSGARYAAGTARRLLEIGEDLALATNRHVLRLEVVLDIDADLGLGQVLM